MYYIVYSIMLISFFGLSLTDPTIKGKCLGILLTVVNALIFYKG